MNKVGHCSSCCLKNIAMQANNMITVFGSLKSNRLMLWIMRRVSRNHNGTFRLK